MRLQMVAGLPTRLESRNGPKFGRIGHLAQIGEHPAEVGIFGDADPRIGVGLVVIGLQREIGRIIAAAQFARLLVGIGDEQFYRNRQDRAISLGAGLAAPSIQDFHQQAIRESRQADRRNAEIAHDFGARRAADRAVEMHFLADGLGTNADRPLDVPELAAMAERLSRQSLFDDLEHFGEARAALVHVDIVGVVFHLGGAAPDAEMQGALRQAVEHGDLFRQPQRMIPGQHQHRGAERQVGKFRGDMRHHQQRAWRRVVIAEMMFQQPRRVIAEFVTERAIGDQVAIELVIGNAGHIGRRRLESEPDILHRSGLRSLRS